MDTGEIARLYTSGNTQDEIAAALGVTQKVVWAHMKRHEIKARKAAKRNQRGALNSSWRGDGIGYAGIHARLRARYGSPKRCSRCGTTDKRKTYDWANLDGNYARLASFVRLCRSCHWKQDKKILNIRHMRKKMEVSR